MNEIKKEVVYLGLSGGVDSAVAAALLLEKGYDVRGIFLKIWSDPIDETSVCPWVQDRRDAAAVAAHLAIPFETVDFEETYRSEVFSYFVREYEAGRTPNPDILCNQVIKFGTFLSYAKDHGADYIATGHHVRREPEAGNDIHTLVRLLSGIDQQKDQSYFLAALNQDQLRSALFPIGAMTKEQVRARARELGLAMVADKPSTKGICFVGDVDLRSFLSKYTKPNPGEIVDMQGNPIGQHEGVSFYTIGQRKGLDIPAVRSDSKPYFVVAKDASLNQLIASADMRALAEKEVVTTNPSWIAGKAPAMPFSCQAKIRSTQSLQNANVQVEDYPESLRIRFDQAQTGIAPGQVVAFYLHDELLGSTVIA